MSRSKGHRGIGSLQPVTAETRGELPARFKLGADTPSNPYNLEIARPAASGVHTYEETRAV